MKRLCALMMVAAFLLPEMAFAEKVKIKDTVTGEEGIYDTVTGELHVGGKIEKVPDHKPNNFEENSTQPIPGLNYSTDTSVDGGVKRAMVNVKEGYVVEARNDALNGAVKVHVVKEGKKANVVLLNKDGKRVSSRGLVKVYMRVPASTPRPFRIKVDGVLTQFAFVSGTNYVSFTAEL